LYPARIFARELVSPGRSSPEMFMRIIRFMVQESRLSVACTLYTRNPFREHDL
jgi:hypothetical protein